MSTQSEKSTQLTNQVEEFNPVEYMAAQGSKKLAASNKQVLKETFVAAAINYAIILPLVAYFRRPTNFKPFLVFQVPVIFFLYSIYLTGCPTYVRSQSNPKVLKLARAGDDLKTDWLIQYYYDVLYITWFLDLLMVVFNTNKVWYIYSVIPLYFSYKLVVFIKDTVIPMYGNKSANPIPWVE